VDNFSQFFDLKKNDFDTYIKKGIFVKKIGPNSPDFYNRFQQVAKKLKAFIKVSSFIAGL
jgi:hypothetical protein